MRHRKSKQKDFNRLKGSFISVLWACLGILISAHTFAQDYHMSYKNDLISLRADKIDLKTIMLDISKKANISISYPSKLKKQITINLPSVSIRNALKRLLRGQDYAIINSDSKNSGITEVYVLPEKGDSIIYFASKHDSISEVGVLSEQRRHKKSIRPQTQSRQAKNLINNYNRRLDALINRLPKATRGSATEKNLLRLIESMARAVEKLENRTL
ncbi:MAG: hypothetical protein JXR49_07980 [Acidobacteria bacterium]|nr:hypothetical protein [Acidobacteriota bacterium]